jgi:hypothetical protein
MKCIKQGTPDVAVALEPIDFDVGDVFVAVSVNIAVFLDVTLCSLLIDTKVSKETAALYSCYCRTLFLVATIHTSESHNP